MFLNNFFFINCGCFINLIVSECPLFDSCYESVISPFLNLLERINVVGFAHVTV